MGAPNGKTWPLKLLWLSQNMCIPGIIPHSHSKLNSLTEILVEDKGAPTSASRTLLSADAIPAEEILTEEIPAEAFAVPMQEPVYVENSGEIQEEDPSVHGWGYGSPKTTVPKKSKKKSQQSSYHSRFHDLVYPLPTDSPRSSEVPNSRDSFAMEDFTPVFLGHARLYVFADYWGVEPLKAITLNKLHKVLCNYTRHEARYGDVVELARYTYDNTPSRRRRDPLRELVVQYLVFEAKEIASSEQCLELVEKGGGFAKDLAGLTMAHLKEALQ